MEGKTNLSNSRLFAEYANDNLKIWNLSIGKPINHANYGEGRILEIIEENKQILIKIFFIDQPKRMATQVFNVRQLSSKSFFNMEIPSEIKDIKEFKTILEDKIEKELAIQQKEQRIREQLERNRRETLVKQNYQALEKKREFFRKYKLEDTLLKDISFQFTNVFACCHLAYYLTYSSGEADNMSSCILRFKDNDEEFTKIFSHLCAQELSKVLNIDYVVRALGSNELVASGVSSLDYMCKVIARYCNTEYISNALTKDRITKPLKLMDKYSRQLEIEGVYNFNSSEIKNGNYILVVDDIITSGASLNAINKAIKDKLPHARIIFFAIGRSHNNSWDDEVNNAEIINYIAENKTSLLRGTNLSQIISNNKGLVNIKKEAVNVKTDSSYIDKKAEVILEEKNEVENKNIQEKNYCGTDIVDEKDILENEKITKVKTPKQSITSKILNIFKRIFNK